VREGDAAAVKSIFDQVNIGGIASQSRIIRSSTAELWGETDGGLTQAFGRTYNDLIKGGVDVVVTGSFFVDGKCRLSPTMIVAEHAAFVARLGQIVGQVHAAGGKIVVQLVHAGAKSGHVEGDARPLAPSDVELMPGSPAREMTRDDIAAAAGYFARAAVRCREAGAVGVQILAGHGYLISQFLSPHFKKRSDEYGGAIENRARILFEVYEAVRQATGPGYPIWVKINSHDLVPDTIRRDEFIWVCRELGNMGIDAIEVSAGLGLGRDSTPARFIKDESDEGSFAAEALALAACLKTQIILTGGFRTPDVIENYLNKGEIEAIGLSRPLIREPGLVNRWRGGQREKSTCVSCNKCFRPKTHPGCQQG